MRKRILQFLVKGRTKACALAKKYSDRGYLCWLSIYNNQYYYDSEEMVYRFHIKLGEKCPWFDNNGAE